MWRFSLLIPRLLAVYLRQFMKWPRMVKDRRNMDWAHRSKLTTKILSHSLNNIRYFLKQNISIPPRFSQLSALVICTMENYLNDNSIDKRSIPRCSWNAALWVEISAFVRIFGSAKKTSWSLRPILDVWQATEQKLSAYYYKLQKYWSGLKLVVFKAVFRHLLSPSIPPGVYTELNKCSQ